MDTASTDEDGARTHTATAEQSRFAGPSHTMTLDGQTSPSMPRAEFRAPPEGEVWEDDATQEPQSSTSVSRETREGTEIQSIMNQFEHAPQQTSASDAGYFPPRAASLGAGTEGESENALQKTTSNSSKREALGAQIMPTSSRTPGSGPASIFQPPPPSPTGKPETDLPFDFHRFLEQLRHSQANPVARYLRSFLLEFGKRQWAVHEQTTIISDFLQFIAKKMAQCEVWRDVTDAEFDNACEGMEKLVMNRLYNQTFSPAIPAPPAPESASSARRQKRAQAQARAAGRRGQHQEDVERDELLTQKFNLYSWIEPEHLDVPGIKDKGRNFLRLAQQELLKINSYRAPRDKIICVLNCCKVIFGFLKSSASDQSADAFIPLLILTVLHAKPDHLVSNVQYILRFRNQEKLNGETSYYISSLSGVLTFIENIDRTNLVIGDEEFEKHVEAAVKGITEGHKPDETVSKPHATPPMSGHAFSPISAALSEKSTLSRPEVTPRNSMEAERISPRRKASERLTEKERAAEQDSSPGENVASGLLRTFQKPLSTIGRMFSDDSTARLGKNKAASGGLSASPQINEHRHAVAVPDKAFETGQSDSDAVEAQRVRAQEHRIVVETLLGMFPDLDKGLISDVVRAKEGRVGEAVDACLALSH